MPGDGDNWNLQWLKNYLKGLEYKEDAVITQLLACGEENFDFLESAARDLVAGTSYQGSCEILEALIDSSYSKMLSGQAHLCWRRMYTDAQILRSLARVDSTTALDSIGRLDRAIIIAGAAGEGRLDEILSLISRIQHDFVPPRQLPTGLRTLTRAHGDPIYLKTSRHSIQSLDIPPSLLSFQTERYLQPFILRNYAKFWPAINEHPWSSAAYLRAVAGPGRLVPVEVGSDYRTDDWSQTLMGWDAFLATLKLDEQTYTPPTDVLYLAQHNLLMQFPELNSDIIVPDYAYASLPSPPGCAEYRPPGNADQLVINGWLGPKGTVSPAHTDPYYNLFVQVVGRKTVWVAPPALSKYMYPYKAQQNENPASNITSPSLCNTSRVDVFTHGLGDDRFPDFWKHVIKDELTMHATLEPGDLLFLPAGWWHGMRAEETSFSVSMWF
ncbi:hypothetical protein VNI00_005958 [Paramarasmius palmivorus]|uniref:JmjC domain-containing protein n=1 Tax=Paramarasmius palmivorus TaxID=297713 RepID=A0AAW0DE81_9AGAR